MADRYLKDPVDGEVYVAGDNSEVARLQAKGYTEVDNPAAAPAEEPAVKVEDNSSENPPADADKAKPTTGAGGRARTPKPADVAGVDAK